MFKYAYPITQDKELEQINSLIYLQLMKLGFRNTRDGTFHFKNIIITAFCEVDKELSYTQSIEVYSKKINKCPITIRSEISQTFCYLNQSRYLNNFLEIFTKLGTETDIKTGNVYDIYQIKPDFIWEAFVDTMDENIFFIFKFFS